MRKKKFYIVICLILTLAFFCSGCGRKSSSRWQDGYYTATMEEYSFGWKEFVTICVMNNKIVIFEYNA